MGYWLDLGRFVIQFSESRSIRSKIIYFCTLQGGKEEVINHVVFLSEARRRGIVGPGSIRGTVIDVVVESRSFTCRFLIAAMVIPVFDWRRQDLEQRVG